MTKSKFAALFEQAAPPTVEPQQPPPGRTERASEPPQAARSIGRPPGKRSDPEWKQFSVLLKKQTQRQAVDRLRDEQASDETRDLSGLLQHLLEQWLAGRSQH